MKINRIKDNDIANGFGITMSIWTQGCPHHCKGCFNGETWSFEDGTEFTKDDLYYILDNINKHGIKRDLSILGGEPLCPENIDGVINLSKTFKEKYPEKKIYLWTGYVVEEFNEIQKKVFEYVDILVDGKFEQGKKKLSLTMRGSSNQRVIDVKKSIEKNKLILLDIDNK
ncbi:anaerobic ribonucleoside-triphosphate reductase activating protein [Terrisporobacter sp.]|uniref:anaerobic ribonucleoside-triphosphate reductase activating protein n=1 Tax=Terrisporobacter sp. TaxID=1965305 RepID=UPI00260D488C|nr:anaerobic ribonucleoside-triphosphate reductase activating protein [Terrisporobacter sp.]